MAYTGKQFEENVVASFDDIGLKDMLMRLYDPMGMRMGVTNACDFILAAEKATVLLECKTTKDARLDFSMLQQGQLIKMMQHVSISDNYLGIVLVYFRHEKFQRVYAINILVIAKYIMDGFKSLKSDDIIEHGVLIDFTKKRVNIRIDTFELLNALNVEQQSYSYGGYFNDFKESVCKEWLNYEGNEKSKKSD